MNPTETEEREAPLDLPDVEADEPEEEDDTFSERATPDAEADLADAEREGKLCDECGAQGGHKLGCSHLDRFRNALEPDEEPEDETGGLRPLRAVVDGRDAMIDRRQAPLIEEEVTDESCLQRIAQCKEEEAERHSIANRAVQSFKEARKRTEAAVTFAAEHYSQSRQLKMDFHVARGGNEPE